jgi:hypothetical protein
MSTMMPRSALRHRPIHTEMVPEWHIASPRATSTHRAPRARTTLPALARAIHPLALIGLSMLLTLLLLWGSSSMWAWGNEQLDHLRYGDPPVTQLDHAVGHEVGQTLTHFEASNVDGQIYVLEIPGGNPAGAHLLVGPYLVGPNADRAPVQLIFQGNPQEPELLVEVAGTVTRFHNTGTTYVPTTP